MSDASEHETFDDEWVRRVNATRSRCEDAVQRLRKDLLLPGQDRDLRITTQREAMPHGSHRVFVMGAWTLEPMHPWDAATSTPDGWRVMNGSLPALDAPSLGAAAAWIRWFGDTTREAPPAN